MPRRNSSVVERKRTIHGATQYHENYRAECAGCPFVGVNFSCTTSDGKCLKTPTKAAVKKKKKGKSKNLVPTRRPCLRSKHTEGVDYG